MPGLRRSPRAVAPGAVTPNIDASLAAPPYPQKGTIRPLSGNTIKVLANRISFRFGCHEDGTGCTGKGVLRIGASTRAPIVATVHFVVFPNHTATLHFTVPRAVRARLAQARHNALPAIVR